MPSASQSNKKNKRRKNEDDSDASSGEEYTCSQTPRREISSQDKTRMAGVIANYIICAEVKKIPVKRPELVKLLSKDHQKHINSIITEAKSIINRVYGYDLVELDSKMYIFVNKLVEEKEELTEQDEVLMSLFSHEYEKTGLLSIILTLIYLSGGTVQEATLSSFLANFDLETDSKTNDPIHGSMTKLMQEYIRQHYIVVQIEKAIDPPIRQYQWGDRAKKEFSKMQILQSVCDLYGGNMKPSMWNEQWKEAKQQFK